MYSQSQYGDSQYPHGPEMGPMGGQVPMDHSMNPARYPYMPNYGSKGPDGAHMAAMANRPPYGSDYGVMGNPDPMYNQNWMLGQGYMGPHGKPSPYGMQGMPNYGASPGYPGGPHHHFSSANQYHPYGGNSQSHVPGASHLSLMQQQAMAGHRFTPPAGASTTGGRSDMGNSSMGESSSYMGNVAAAAGVHGHSGSGSPGPPWPSSQQLHPPHGSASGTRGFGKEQVPSPAPPSSTSSGGLPYHSPEYPSPQPSTPNSSQASAVAAGSTSSSSRLKSQEASGSSSLPSASTASSSSSQKPVDLSSPRNSEVPKAPSISCLREALLATTSITSTSQQFASYSSSRMIGRGTPGGGGGGGSDHQPSPLTPSGHHPSQDAASILSPQSRNNAPVRQDSQLSSSSVLSTSDQEHQLPPYPMQNSLAHHQQRQLLGQAPPPSSHRSDSSTGKETSSGHQGSNSLSSIPREDPSQSGSTKHGPDTDIGPGTKSDQLSNAMATSPQLMGATSGGGSGQRSSSTSSSPLANPTSRGGGTNVAVDGGAEGVLGSPRVVESPRNSAILNSATSGSSVGSNRQSPAPTRPDLLGFPVRSSSFRGENQPSPLAEDAKNARKFSSMPPIDRRHPTIASQYNGDQKRKDFLDLLFNFLEKEGVQVTRLPTICKAPFDLYQIFNSVQHHGGFLNVVEKRLWRDVIKTAYGSTVTNPTSSSVRTLQQYYKKLLLPYECHVGSTDVSSCLSKLDNAAPSRQASTSSPSSSQISSDGESNSNNSSKTLGGERMANHLSETPPNSKADSKKPSVEARVNGETLCAVAEPTALLDGEHVVERVNSKGNLVSSAPPRSLSAIGAAQTPDGTTTTNGSAASRVGGATTESHHPSSASSSCSSSGVSQLGNVTRDDGVPPAPLKTVNSTELDDDRSLDFPDDSRDSYPQPDLSEPLPEMSVQEAESVLGMSPAPYPNHDGPGTPSTGVPSPTHFPSHFQKQHRMGGSMGQPSTPGSAGTPTGGSRGGGGGGQEYPMDGSDVGGVSTAGGVNAASGPAPSSYPPPYPNPMDVPPGSYPPHHMHPSLYGPSPHPSSHGYPPYNNPPMFPPNRHYGDMPGDYSSHHPGMTSGSMMQHPYPGGRGGPYPSGGSHRNSVDYHPHHPHHGPYPHPQMMGGGRDVPPYPSSQGMTQSEWHWHQQHQQRQMMSAQQSHIYHRMQQQQHAAMMRQQQQAAMNAAMHQQQQQQQQSSSRNSPAISSPEAGKPSWQQHHHNQTHSHKANPTSSSSAASASPSFTGGSSMSKMSNEKARSSHHKPHPHRHHTDSLETKLPQGVPKVSSDSSAPTPATSQASVMPESLKRSLPDWSNCVEGTKPQLVKRRKLYSYHCGHVEPWRLMMSLKSGLLADSTWALDTLTILLHDENTYGYFNLRHHHSLLNTLVDHFKVTLEAIFDITFEDTEKYVSGYSGNNDEEGGSDRLDERTTQEAMAEATKTDYDILASKEKEKNGDGKVARAKFKGVTIPVAASYNVDELKLGRSDVLSHVMVSTWEKSMFPEEKPTMLELLSESKRRELEEQSQLQRVDQTPVSVLLRREAILSQIPFHRFGRLSHSPRRRERNFFGSTRSLDGQGSGGMGPQPPAGEDSGTGTATKEPEKNSSTQDKTEESGSKRESVCKSPVGDVSDILWRRSSVLGRRESCPSPVLVEENEVYKKEDLPLWSIPPSKEQLWKRCETLSNILRSLTFVTGNDVEFCQHSGILVILGKLLLLHHYHLVRPKQKKPTVATESAVTTAEVISSLLSQPSSMEDKETNSSKESSVADDSSVFAPKSDQQGRQFVPAKEEWWWDCLNTLREDVLVILANISGQLDLSIFPESISFPIIDGLLHWLVCPSSVAIDLLPESSKVYLQSPRRLVVETFAKMTISESNVDLILATPPLMRLDVVFSQLAQMVCQKKYPVVRQFALVLLSNLAQGHECCSRLIGQQKMVISHLLECLETAEQMVCTGQSSFEGGYAKDDPSSLSVAMLRRAATTLYCISRVPANRTAFLPYRNRILYLSTSQYVEPSVSSILMDMLYEFGKL